MTSSELTFAGDSNWNHLDTAVERKVSQTSWKAKMTMTFLQISSLAAASSLTTVPQHFLRETASQILHQVRCDTGRKTPKISMEIVDQKCTTPFFFLQNVLVQCCFLRL